MLPIKFWSAVAEKSKMCQPIRGHPFSDRPEKHKVGYFDNVDYLFPVKFRKIPFSGCREVENISANQRPVWQSLFSDRPENHT